MSNPNSSKSPPMTSLRERLRRESRLRAENPDLKFWELIDTLINDVCELREAFIALSFERPMQDALAAIEASDARLKSLGLEVGE